MFFLTQLLELNQEKDTQPPSGTFSILHSPKLGPIGLSKTSNYIQIKIKMTDPSQEPPASSKAPNEDFKDMDVLCTLKIMIES